MSGIKGRSGGSNKTTLRDKQIKGERAERICRNPPARIGERIPEIEGLGEIGKKIFAHFEPMLHNNGTIDTTDAVSFHLLCRRYQDWYDQAKKCEDEGRFFSVKNKDGDVIDIKIAAWAKLETIYLDQLKSLCREFGLTPVSRSGVERIAKNEKTNPFEGITK